MSFSLFALHPSIAQAVTAAGYSEPTPVQARAIPEALTGRDLLVSAPTGTGKTAAFVLPALQRIAAGVAKPGRGPRVLVLTPTRELALQITTAVAKYGSSLRSLRCGSVVGGMPYPKQRQLLQRPLDILIATPGRLIDFIDQRAVDFSRLEMLVLDEADRMLDMGFIEPVKRIAGMTPPDRQTLLYSATLDGNISRLAQQLLKNPQRIEIAAVQTRHEQIDQRVHLVDDGSHKHRLLEHFLRGADMDQAIVFTATKRGADRLAEKLNQGGHGEVAALHGDMNQSQRNRTLARMRTRNIRVLVATDVAARGIDVASITHVINYDLPRIAEDYVHRIGRTGRAGASGIAISFAAPEDARDLKLIERYTGNSIQRHTVAGMEPKPRPAGFPPARNSRNGPQRFSRGRSSGGRGASSYR